MEVWEVVGVDTQAERTIREEGKKYQGVCFYLIGDAPEGPDGRYLGRICREQFVTNDRMREACPVAPHPGDVITLYFNRYGGIAKIDVMK